MRPFPQETAIRITGIRLKGRLAKKTLPGEMADLSAETH